MADAFDYDSTATAHMQNRVNWKNPQYSNEKTPKSKQIFSTTLLLNSACSTSGHNYLSSSQYQLSNSSPSLVKTQYSTPKNVAQTDKNNSIQKGFNAENEFSITNPFENQSTIDSLLQPSLSPSLFDSVSNQGTSVNQSPGSFWNIDQIALMKPADIDLSKLHEQQNFVKFDPAVEVKAQKAIDSFFANGVNLTSPWSSSDRPHYLAIISPAVPPSSRKKQLRKQDPASTPSTFSKNVGKVQPHEAGKVNAATQTMLSLPFDVDLSKLLGKYFREDVNLKSATDPQSGEILSNSSLRRKLFFHDAEDDAGFDDDHLYDQKQHREGVEFIEKACEDNDVFAMRESPFLAKNKTPISKSGSKTPLLKSKQLIQKTPSSCQSPFSSSPVTGGRMFDLGTPFRAQGQDKFECFSPGSEYSPIRSDSDCKSASIRNSDKRLADSNMLTSSDLTNFAAGNSGDFKNSDSSKPFVTS